MATVNTIGYGSVIGSNQFNQLSTGGLTNTVGFMQPAMGTYSTWATTTAGSTYQPYFEMPPWINDDMLDDNQAKKIYEFITGEDQGNVPKPVGAKAVPDFQPRHSVVIRVMRELQGARIFRGGTNEEWENIKKLADDWRAEAIKKGMIGTNLQVMRVDRAYVEQYYQFITKAWTYRKHSDKYSQIGDIAVDAYQVVKDAIREFSDKEEGLAVLEYEMLKAGGMILGTNAQDMNTAPAIVVLFESLGKSTMEKLMGEGSGGKRKKSPNTKRATAGWGTSNPLQGIDPFGGTGVAGGGLLGWGGTYPPGTNTGGYVVTTNQTNGYAGGAASYSVLNNNVTLRFT